MYFIFVHVTSIELMCLNNKDTGNKNSCESLKLN